MQGFKVFIYLPLLVMGLVMPVFAQQPATGSKAARLTGSVIDSVTFRPIEMATITLLNQSGKIISGATSNATGIFTLNVPEEGSYLLAVTFLGYKPYRSAYFKWPDERSDPVVQLQPNVGQLTGVTVAGRKALIRNESDKIVYNAAADISNKAGSAADVLRHVPMVTVGANGEVRIRGNSNIKVLLNGVATGILARNLKEALKMIPAGTILSIEVITSPSAKYEAEGAAGIINIITAKKVKGKDGNVTVSAGNLEQSVSGGINIAGEKVDFGLNVSGRKEMEKTAGSLQRESLNHESVTGNLIQRTTGRTEDKSASIDVRLGYRPDSSQKFSASASFWYGSWPNTTDLYNWYKDQSSRSEYQQSGRQTGSYSWTELMFNYQKKFRRKNQEIELQSLYTYSADRTAYETRQFNLSGLPLFMEKSPNREKDKHIDLQLDYSHPLNQSGKNLLETGLRFGRNNSSSIYSVFNNEADPAADPKEIPSRSGAMKYYREVIAAYASLKFTTNNNWMLRPGVRYEFTRTGADFATSPSFTANFNNLVPSILLTKEINAFHSFKLHYIERIRRPWIWDLNPYVNASDPKNLTFGNPELRPEVTKMMEFGHNYEAASGFSLNSSIYYNTTSNAIESITTVDSLGISRTTSQNIAANKRLGVNTNAYIPVNERWRFTAGGEIYHVKFKSGTLNMKNNAVFFAFNLNTSYEFPRNYTLQLSADYSNVNITLQGRNSASYSYRIAVQKELMQKRASIMLGLNNPFQQTFREYSRVTAPSFRSLSTTHFYNRSVTLSFSWKFGSRGKTADQQENTERDQREGMPHRKR